MPSDHVHERGEHSTGQFDWVVLCRHCGMGFSEAFWDTREAYLAELMANGLPGHQERLNKAVAEGARNKRMGHSMFEVVSRALMAYRAPLEKEE